MTSVRQAPIHEGSSSYHKSNRHRKSHRQAWGARPALITVAIAMTMLAMPLRALDVADATGLQDRDASHAIWSVLLERCVTSINDGHSTEVDYDCFAANRPAFDGYLNDLSALTPGEFARYTRDEQLAFLINAYNAWTVALILQAWPDLESIRDLGSLIRSPWKKAFIPLLGETISLDDIEHGMIREAGRFDEPRIHFAVNCASIGCPALRREAYTAAELDRQLEDQTEQFLGDRTRNRVRNGRLEVTSLFKWYRGDFEAGWRDARSVAAFLLLYADSLDLSPAQRRDLTDERLPISFLDYDWNLNSVQR